MSTPRTTGASEAEVSLLALGPHDRRVAVGTTYFFVKVVRRGALLLRGGRGSELGLWLVVLGLPILWIASKVPSRWIPDALRRLPDRVGRSRPVQAWAHVVGRVQRARGWKVGVMRVDGDPWGATGGVRVVHLERLRPGPVPSDRVAALATAASAGRFADAGRRWGRSSPPI